MAGMNLSTAQKIIDQGVSQAQDRAVRPICIAVCDAQGFLVSFARMDQAPVRSIWIARSKAYTSVRLGVTTAAFRARLKREESTVGDYGDDMLTSLPGGAVILLPDGDMSGGVGVSGLSPAEDQAWADELAAFAVARLARP